jgi:hypothetical protein
MKLTLSKLAVTAFCGLLAATGAQANTILTVGTSGPYIVGEVIPGVNYGNFGGQAGGDAVMVNTLIPMGLNTSKTVSGQGVGSALTDYFRSGNAFSPLPTAVTTGALFQSGGGLTLVNGNNYVELTLPAGFTYLAAKWDGPNGGAMVYDIAGLAAGTVIDLPNVAFDHGMTGWTLLDGNGGTVPDGGATAILLGMSLTGFGLLRRKLS